MSMDLITSIKPNRLQKIYDENGNAYQITSYDAEYSFDSIRPKITVQKYPVRRTEREEKAMGSRGLFNSLMPKIKKVIYNPPATVILWDDGTKSVVKTQNGEFYDAEKGLAMAFMRKFLNNKDYHKYLEEARNMKHYLLIPELPKKGEVEGAKEWTTSKKSGN